VSPGMRSAFRNYLGRIPASASDYSVNFEPYTMSGERGFWWTVTDAAGVKRRSGFGAGKKSAAEHDAARAIRDLCAPLALEVAP
jgi:hypothetical protein